MPSLSDRLPPWLRGIIWSVMGVVTALIIINMAVCAVVWIALGWGLNSDIRSPTPTQTASVVAVVLTSTPTPTLSPTQAPTDTQVSLTATPSPTQLSMDTPVPVTATPSPTQLPIDTPVPPGLTQTPTNTPGPPTSTLTNTPVLPTSTPTPTPVPPVPTPTPSPTVPSPPRGAIILLNPSSVEIPTYEAINFEWEWSGDPIPPEFGFEVYVWLEGYPQTVIHNAVRDHKTGRIEQIGQSRYHLGEDTIRYAKGVLGSSGIYSWTVALVQIDPTYADFGLQAPPLRFRYEAD